MGTCTKGGIMVPKIDVLKTGENIKRLMGETGVTPKDIQERCGFSTVQPVYHWMSGRNLPTVDNLLILSYVLDCSMEKILVFNDEP